MIALPFFIPMVCKQKPVFSKKPRLYLIWKWTGVLKDRSFHQKPCLYLIWKWTGLSKDRLFIKTPVSNQYGSGPVFQKIQLFIKNTGFLTQNSLFFLVFKVIKRLNQSFHFFIRKNDYKHVRRV